MARLIQPTFNKGELSPELHGRVDTEAYVGGLAEAYNVQVHTYGGVSRRPGLKYIGPVADHSYGPRLIRFQFKTTDSYIIELGDLYARFIRDDGHVLTSEQTVSDATNTNPVVVTVTAHGYSNGEEVYFGAYTDGGTDIGGMTQLNRNRYIVANATTDTFELTDQVTGANVNGTSWGTFSSSGTVNKIYQITTPWTFEDVWELDYTQSADVMTLVHPDYEARELTRTDHDAWTLSTITYAPSIGTPTNFVTSGTGGGSTAFTFKVTAVHVDTGEESAPATAIKFNEVGNSTNGPTNNITLDWDPVDDALEYRIYIGLKGSFRFVDTAVGNTYIVIGGEAGIADVDATQRPPIERDPLSAANDRPGAVGFFQQRRIFGGSNNLPDTSHFSQPGAYNNFNYSVPQKDDDAIQATLASGEVNVIRHYAQVSQDLIILTSGAEWRVHSNADVGLTPNTIQMHPQSNWGCSLYQPLIIGNTLLFITEDLGNVRSLGYSLEQDSYRGNNLNVLSRHLLDGYALADWGYIRTPDTIVYLVRSDGMGLALAYDEEQKVIAWTRIDTSGKFEAVGTLRGGGTYSEDSVYWVVQREVNGNTVRYIEVMRDTWFDDPRDAFFVDSGLSLNTPLTITNITSANPVVVTAPSHGLSNADVVDLDNIVWEKSIDASTGAVTTPDHLNGGRYVVANKTSNTFELQTEAGNDVDGSNYANYEVGGFVRLTTDTVTGLEHLEGETVTCLCDGNVIIEKVVTDATITFNRKFSRIHIGLPYTSQIKTLRLEHGQGTIQGMLKKLYAVTVRFFRSRDILIGPDEDNLVQEKLRETENLGDPTALYSGDKRVLIGPLWHEAGQLVVRQPGPLPMTILALIPELDIEDS